MTKFIDEPTPCTYYKSISIEPAPSLEQQVGHLLSEKRASVATAESCTGGLLAHKITSVPGSSAFFQLGLIVYANQWKQELLGVPEALLVKEGAVSAEVAQIMATAVRKRAKATYGIGITGIAGPGGGTDHKPVGLVYIGMADAQSAHSKRFEFDGNRNEIKECSARAALAMLLTALKNK